MRKLLTIVLLLALAACAPSQIVNPIVNPTVPPGQVAPTTINPPASTGADAVNDFALDMYKTMATTTDGNMFFSPLSITTALTMTFEGAKGDTAAQMASVLHLPADMTAVHSFYSDFLKRTPTDYKLSMANAIWPQKDYAFNKEFTDILSADYAAGSQPLDYVGNTEGARQTINSWVESKTNNLIKELIPQGILDAYTRMVLTNAIYMKADWVSQFEKESTYKEPFKVATGTKDVDMMHQTSHYMYGEDADTQVLEMPYVGGDLSMVVLLPKNDIKTVEASIKDKLALPLTNTNIQLSLPKVEMTQAVKLNDVLQALGMQDAFTDKADFSGMDGEKDLYISAVLHKAFVRVDEKGTEAAAATAVVMRTMAAMPQESTVFKADHPFVMVIKDDKSGAILFMGRVMEP